MRTGAARLVAGAAAVLALVTTSVATAGAQAVTGTNDPLFLKQWGLGAIGAPEAWAGTTGAGVLIGVVDTGAELSHQDLAAQIVASTDCVGSGGNPLACEGSGVDDNGHGTAVAGIAAAATDNRAGIAGAAPGARLLVAKAVNRDGNGSIADVNAAIQWVVGHGATIVNLSLGDPTLSFSSLYGESLRQGIEYAWSQGAIPVLGAGNAAALGLTPAYPSDLDAVVVGASSRSGAPTVNTAPTGDAKWAIMAPGGSTDGVQADDILSTSWSPSRSDTYSYVSGTGMAAPLVSAALAMLLSDGLSPQQAVDRLLATTSDPAACGPASATCKGVVDVAQAVSGLRPGTPTPASTYPPSPSTSGTSGTGPAAFGAAAPSSTAPSAPTTGAPRRAPSPAPAPPAPPAGPANPTNPAVMRPGPTTTPPAPTVAGRARAGTEAAGPLPPVASVAAGHHGKGADLAWALALAGVFALLVAGGVLRVTRARD